MPDALENVDLSKKLVTIPYQSLDENERIITVNDKWLDILGYKKKEVIGKWFGNFLSSKYVDSFKKKFKTFKTEGEIHSLELELIKKDGSTILVSFDGRISYDSDDNFQCTQCIFKDISSHIKKLRNETNKFYYIFNSSPMVITLSTFKDGVFVDVNDTFTKLLGWTKEEVIGKSSIEVGLLTEPAEKWRKKFINLLENHGSLSNTEFIFRDKKGKKLRGLLSAEIIKIDNTRYVLSNVVDITEYTDKSEKKHKDLEKPLHYLQNVINNVSEIIISFDKLYNIKNWNNKIASLTGYSQKEVYGRSIKKIDFIENKEKLLECFKKNNFENKKYEIILKTKEGDHRVVRGFCINIPVAGEYIFVGKEVTNIKNNLDNIFPGSSYLGFTENKKYMLSFFNNLIHKDYHGVFVSRKNNVKLENKNISRFFWSKNNTKKSSLSSIEQLIPEIYKKLQKHPKLVIYIERFDCPLINSSFDEIMKKLYELNDIIHQTNSILFLNIDKSLLDNNEIVYLNSEFLSLPNQSINDLHLRKEEINVLNYINEKNKKNILVSYKDISNAFSIASSTTTSWLKKLAKKNLINIKKRGKNKYLFTSEKGKNLLN